MQVSIEEIQFQIAVGERIDESSVLSMIIISNQSTKNYSKQRRNDAVCLNMQCPWLELWVSHQ